MVVYLQFSTSNHNLTYANEFLHKVVYLQFSTSNHNGSVPLDESSKLYIFSFLHQTTTLRSLSSDRTGCISLVFYIKPQQYIYLTPFHSVVYLQFSTSNHNRYMVMANSLRLYIFSFLHQTTTLGRGFDNAWKLYIFSFLHQTTTSVTLDPLQLRLYIFSFLHQTTTDMVKFLYLPLLYIFSFLHQTTTMCTIEIFRLQLYIFSFLHQTTTIIQVVSLSGSCISLVFYIKPQPMVHTILLLTVVYLQFSTSNHNLQTT